MVERFQWFLAPALMAFLLAAGLSRGRPAAARTPRRGTAARRGAAAAALMALLAGSAFGADADTNRPAPPASASVPAAAADRRAEAARAWRLYQSGNYQAAAEAWRQAAGDAPGTSARSDTTERQLRNTLLYNAACALYRAGAYREAAELFAEAARQSGPADGDVLYNQGRAWWQAAAGDASAGAATNAPDIQPDDRIDMLEKAALAFQRAARANGDGGDARSGLDAAAEVLPREREQARLQKVLKQYGDKPPAELTDEILRRQRAIAAESAAALTAAPPDRVENMEALADRQRDAADLLGPLRMALESGSATNAPPQLDMYFQALREAMLQTRTRLRDLDPRSPEAADTAAGGVYNLWKELAPFPAVLQEGLLRQTNALAHSLAAAESQPSAASIRDDQAETQVLTELFLDRFTNAVPETGAPPPSAPDGQPPDPEQGITPEKRANIIKLAREALDRQQEAQAALNKPDWPAVRAAQQNSRDLLQAIQKLLPPPPPPPQQDQPQDQDQQKQDQQKQDQKQDQQKQDQQQDQQQDQEKQDQKQDQPQSDRQEEEQKPEEEQKQEEKQEQPEQEQPEQPQPAETNEQAAAESAEEDDQKEMTPEQALRLLQRAAEREKEYRQRHQRQYAPLSPTDRDW